MCMKTNEIIKSRDVIFIEDSTNIRNDLEMCSSGRNEAVIDIIVNTSSISLSIIDDDDEDDIEKTKEEVRDA